MDNGFSPLCDMVFQTGKRSSGTASFARITGPYVLVVFYGANAAAIQTKRRKNDVGKWYLKGSLMIRKLMRKEFDSVFQMLETSFPKDEYRTYEEQKALLGDSAYEVYVLPDSDDHTIKAFIAVWEFDSFAFIDHFAVNPKHRGQGVGGEFLRETVRMLGKMVCLEVEPPDNETASRRISFYERSNFFLNKYPYTLPPISAGRNPVPLLIMTYGRYISEMEFSQIEEELFTRVYKRS